MRLPCSPIHPAPSSPAAAARAAEEGALAFATLLALTTSIRTPAGRIVVEVETRALMKLGATGADDFLGTYVRHSACIEALALQLALERSTRVVRIGPDDVPTP